MKIEIYKGGEPVDVQWNFAHIPRVGDYIMANAGGMVQFVVSSVCHSIHIDTVQINVVHTLKTIEDYAKKQDQVIEQQLQN